MHADDVLIYRPITSLDNSKSLQDGLNNIGQWGLYMAKQDSTLENVNISE